jgi:hypothetical protein
MEEVYHTYKPVPYGWWVIAAAVARGIGRVLRAPRGLKNESAAAPQLLDGGLNHPAGPH